MEATSDNETSTSLAEHLRFLEGERNPFTAPTKHRMVQEYIEEHLGLLRPGTLRRHTFTWQDIQGLNLILEVPGREAGPPVLIGAHYDSVPGSPGADDNASGVAVLLELARSLSQSPPRYTIWLVAFDLEEMGMVGSKALAQKLKQDGTRPLFMASLEMVGYRSKEPGSQRYPFPFQWFYPDRADFILLLGNVRAHRLIGRMAKALEGASVRTERFTVPLGGKMIPASRLSDQSPFWDTGVAGVMVTDTAWLRNPHYHAPTDTMNTLDFGFMAATTRGLASLLKERG